MSIRRRIAVRSERGLVIYAANLLLQFDRYRARLGEPSSRPAVERALTPEEMKLVNHLGAGDLPSDQHDALLARLGPVPDWEETLGAMEQILGRPVRRGR